MVLRWRILQMLMRMLMNVSRVGFPHPYGSLYLPNYPLCLTNIAQIVSPNVAFLPSKYIFCHFDETTSLIFWLFWNSIRITKRYKKMGTNIIYMILLLCQCKLKLRFCPSQYFSLSLIRIWGWGQFVEWKLMHIFTLRVTTNFHVVGSHFMVLHKSNLKVQHTSLLSLLVQSIFQFTILRVDSKICQHTLTLTSSIIKYSRLICNNISEKEKNDTRLLVHGAEQIQWGKKQNIYWNFSRWWTCQSLCVNNSCPLSKTLIMQKLIFVQKIQKQLLQERALETLVVCWSFFLTFHLN